MSAAHTLQSLSEELARQRQRNEQLQAEVLSLQQALEKVKGAAREASNSRLLAEEELDDTRDRLQLALDAAQLAFWEWHLHSGVVYTSARWGEMLGDLALEAHTPANELLDKLHPDDLPPLIQIIEQARTGALMRYEVKFRVQTVAGDWLWTESHGMVAEQDPQGRAVRMIGVCADIQERMRVQQLTEKARHQAEAANRAKTEFLANVSHEVRTPLNGVMGLIRLLMDSPLTAEQAHWLQLMDDSAHSLLVLLNDILDLSKIEAGKMTVERTVFDVAEATERACAPLLTQASAKPLQVELVLRPGLPQRAEGDPGRLRQVLTNLLSNAVKFTPAHGRVRVVVQPTSTNGVRFEVIDSGIGIAPEQQQRVFEAFTQADASTTRKFGGTGLGLAISAQLVSLMGGRLQVESRPGQGSRFFFTLPLADQSERPHDTGPLSAPMELAHLQAEAQTFEGLRVLVAEDHPVNELLMRQLLKRLGCETTVAKNGLEAVAAWKRGGIDLIMMDVQMPELSGLDATAEIRRLESAGSTHTPIVAVTANAMSGDADKCLTAGMDAYTSKPVSPQALTKAMATAIAASKRWENAPAAEEPPPAPQPPRKPPQPTPALDAEKLRHRLGHNPRTLAEWAKAAQQQIAQHRQGLDRALAEQDPEQAKALAHTLKGTLASLTAQRAAALANGLEMAARSKEWALFARALPVLHAELTKVDAALQALRPEP